MVAALRGTTRPRGLSDAPFARGASAADVLRHVTGLNAGSARPLPWWQSHSAPPLLPPQSLPSATDVLVVGAGYTGLSAARETAAAGLATHVLEAGRIGA